MGGQGKWASGPSLARAFFKKKVLFLERGRKEKEERNSDVPEKH